MDSEISLITNFLWWKYHLKSILLFFRKLKTILIVFGANLRAENSLILQLEKLGNLKSFWSYMYLKLNWNTICMKTIWYWYEQTWQLKSTWKHCESTFPWNSSKTPFGWKPVEKHLNFKVDSENRIVHACVPETDLSRNSNCNTTENPLAAS